MRAGRAAGNPEGVPVRRRQFIVESGKHRIGPAKARFVGAVPELNAADPLVIVRRATQSVPVSVTVAQYQPGI